MPRKKDVLYPEGYTEAKPPAPGENPHRDKDAVRALIRDATSSEALTVEQLCNLVCGHTVQTQGLAAGSGGGDHLDVTVAEERDDAIAAAKLGNRNLRGPECAKSLRRREVVALVREEIAAREAGWDFSATEVAKPKGEAKVIEV